MSLDHSEHLLSLRFLFGYGDFSRATRTRCRRPLLSRIRRISQDNHHAHHREGGISADDRHVGDPRGTVLFDPVETATDRRTPESTRSPGFYVKDPAYDVNLTATRSRATRLLAGNYRSDRAARSAYARVDAWPILDVGRKRLVVERSRNRNVREEITAR